MQRTASFLALILIGGLAAGLGTYSVLTKANADRARLAEIAFKAREESKTATETSHRTVAEANKKLEKANDEIVKAQRVIDALHKEREQIARATHIQPPASRLIKGWKEAVQVELGLSLKFPPTSFVETNDASALTIARKLPSPATLKTDARWLSIMPYDNRLETELISRFATSTAVSFLIDGRLLIGAKGILAGMPGEIYVLRVQKAGVDTHLLWARRSDSDASNTLFTTLATLSFAR